MADHGKNTNSNGGSIRSAFKVADVLKKKKRKMEIQEIETLPRKERSKRVRQILKSR